MFLTLIFVSIALLALAVLGLGVSIFFRKNGKFPETGVGHNPEMRKLGLNCARSEEMKKFQLNQSINTAKGQAPEAILGNSGCAGCSCTTES